MDSFPEVNYSIEIVWNIISPCSGDFYCIQMFLSFGMISKCKLLLFYALKHTRDKALRLWRVSQFVCVQISVKFPTVS